jgi:GT2 family glycosyltransferase
VLPKWEAGIIVTVAVVVVTYNSNATLGRCLDCIAKQTLKPARTIVIDNASPNGFPNDALADHAQIEVLRNPNNVGFAAANNQALQMLQSDPHITFVALLNPDAFPDATWLAELVDAAERYPDYDALASRMMVAGTHDIIDGLGDVYHVSGLAWRARHGQSLQPPDLDGQEVFGVCAGAGFYRLSALTQLGGFDTELFCYLEDVDLSFRLRRMGKRCRYVPNAVVWHIGGVSTRDNAAFRLYYGHRNMIFVYLKNMPTALLLLTLPVHIAVNLIGIIRSLWRGDSSVVLRAKYDAIHAIGRVIAQRKELESLATVGSLQLFPHLSKSLVRDVAGGSSGAG